MFHARRRVHTSPIPRRRPDPGAHRGAGQGIAFTENGKRAILHKLIEAEGFEKFIEPVSTRERSASASTAVIADPALEQIISAAALGVGRRLRHGAPRPPQRARRSCRSRTGPSSTVQGVSRPDDVEDRATPDHLGASSDRELTATHSPSVADGQSVHLRDRQSRRHGQGAAKQDQVFGRSARDRSAGGSR